MPVEVRGTPSVLTATAGEAAAEMDYRQACEANAVQLGKMHVVASGALLIINFPTKAHWRAKSKPADIEAGSVHPRTPSGGG